MGLKRYDMIVSQSGNHMQEKTGGDWVDAGDAQAEIDQLKNLLREACDGLDTENEIYKRIQAVLDAE